MAEPQALRWEDLQYSVGRRDGGSKLLLSSGVCGLARTGRTFAIMGPSGAGKTTLLSVLAGDPTTCAKGKISGRITLDGRPRQASAFREQSCLVRQVDVLLATATVRETLMFHALLQLPRTMPRQAKQQRVEQVLELLGLVACADTMIGDSQAGIKGISGGERRRLALGVELIKEPTIIFIDEPTTGLDSETALQVMQYVASLARDHGRMVIFNIHQPNGDIAELFDDLLLLAPGGRAVFSGNSKSALAMFSGLGHELPQFKAPCDFYMALLASEQTVGQLAAAWATAAVGAGDGGGCAGDWGGGGLPMLRTAVAGAAGRQRVRDIENGSGTPGSTPSDDGDSSPVAARFEVVLASHGAAKDGAQGKGSPRGNFGINSPRWRGRSGSTPTSSGSRLVTVSEACRAPSGLASGPSGISAFKAPPPVRRQRPSWCFEVWVLSQRSWRWWLRNPAMLLSEFAQYLLVCLIMGSIYWQVQRTPSGAYDRMGGLFAMVATVMATAPSRALMAWDKERRLLKWELANSAYRLSSFVVSKMLVSLPVEAIQVYIVSSIYYLMMGLGRTGGQYWTAMSILALLSVNADIIGHLVAVLTPDIAVAFPVLSVLMTIVLAVTGFVVQNIPKYWAWIQKISCCSYAFAALVLNEFHGLEVQLPGSSNVEVAAINYVPSSIGIDRFATVAGFVLVLLGITGVTLALAMVLTLLVVKFKLMGF